MSSTDIFRAKAKRQKFSPKILWPLVFVGPVVALIFLHQKFLTIQSLNCRLGEKVCPESLENIIGQIQGESVLRLNQRNLRDRLRATGLVGEVKFTFNLPGRLSIIGSPPSTTFFLQSVFSPIIPSLSFVWATQSAEVVAPSVELSAFVATVEGKTFGLLSTGVLNQEEAQTPYFLISEKIPKKEYLTKTFLWLKSLSESHLKPQAIFLLPSMVVVQQTNQPDWIMNFDAKPNEVLLALQQLGEVVTIKKPSVIDFRYANPILK